MLICQTISHAAITVTPSTWNVIGLDSNSPSFGPYRYPIGAKVCGGTAGDILPVTFTWDRTNPYVNLRPGSAGTPGNPMTVTLGTDGCADAFFEVELDRTSAAFTDFTTNLPARYHISAGGVSTPTPREIIVERLVSQSRNAISNMEFGTDLASMTSVPNGGSMDLVVGNTYYIRMTGYTATQGYEQLESFVGFPNTIFQIQSVSTTYSADTSPFVNSPSDKLYADSCGWDNDPNSPSYLSCWADGKAGGTVIVTYQVKILSTGSSGRESLNTLIHDFSGSSFHYNADFSSSARFVNLIDPTTVTIEKRFTPDPIVSNGTTSLTFTLSNPNSGTVSNVNFVDTFPTSPDFMLVASPLATSNTCGGTLSDESGGALGAGSSGISLTGATIPAYSSCAVKVNVTAATQGTYTNTSNNLFVGTIDTTDSATNTLVIDDTAIPPPPAPPSSCATPVEFARWDMTSTTFTSKASDVSSATATSTGGSFSIDAFGNPTNSWAGTGWAEASPATALPYFLFSLDTSNYGGVSIQYDYYMNSGEWAAPKDNFMIIDSQADSGGFTEILNANVGKGSWTTIPTTGGYTAATTGSSTTDFKIRAYGAKVTPSPGVLYIDNVVFYGCARVDTPTISKAFSPAPVAVGGTSTLTFTITNPNTDSALTGVTFSDTFPSGLAVATTPNESTTCGGSLTNDSGTVITAGDTGIQLSGGSLALSGSCTVSVDVTPSAAGTYENISGFVSSTESGANTDVDGTASAQLTALAPPAIEKAFGTNPVFENAPSTLTFTITNPNTGNGLSGIAFSDTFPPGMTIASTPNESTTCGGSLTNDSGTALIAGDTGIQLSGGSLALSGSCTVSVNVTSATAGSYVNTSGAVTHTLNGNWGTDTATDTLLVETPNPAIALLKQVSSSSSGPWSSYLPVAVGDSVYYKFTVENLGDVPLTGVDVYDTSGLPATLSMNSCTWSDGDTNPLTAPFDLPIADADNGHIATCILGPATAVAGININVAEARGTYNTPDDTTDTSTATYATSSLTLSKSATESYFLAAGDPLNYTYTITNTGADLPGPLTISITDNKISSVSCEALTDIGDNDIDFDNGEVLSCTATYTVTASDVTNKQVTNIARAQVGSFYTPTATATVPLGPDLSVVKTNSVSGTAATSTPFDWTLTVTNSSGAGSAAAFSDGEILLTDDLPSSGATYIVPAVATNGGGTTGVISCAITTNTLTCSATGPVSIPPGDSFSIAINTTPTFASPPDLVNPRSGGSCSVDPNDTIVETDDTNNDCADSVTVVTPAMTLVKAADLPYFVIAGEVINYTYTVSNTGAVAQPGPVTITDDKTSVTCPDVTTVGNGDGNLDPLEQIVCTSSYTVLAADVTAREVTNTASATVGAATTPEVSLTIPIGPDLSVTKTNDLISAATPGVAFNWILTASNAPTAGAAATYNSAELLLTDELPNVGATYNGATLTATNIGGTTGTISCAVDGTSTLNCNATSSVSIPPGGGFSINVETTPTIAGTLDNPRSGGTCRIDPDGPLPYRLVAETDETNNDCSDSITVGTPNITMLKTTQPIWDPINGSTNAKAIPGALVLYTLLVSNTGYGATDADSVVITDAVPANSELFVADINGPGSGPVHFTDGATPSALSYNYVSLNDLSDDLAFSDDSGANFTKNDTTPDGNNCDPSVTNFKVSLGGTFLGSDGTNHPSFTLIFRTRIK